MENGNLKLAIIKDDDGGSFEEVFDEEVYDEKVNDEEKEVRQSYNDVTRGVVRLKMGNDKWMEEEDDLNEDELVEVEDDAEEVNDFISNITERISNPVGVPHSCLRDTMARCGENNTQVCDRETVRMLAHMIPANDRARVNAWLKKLDRCENPVDRSQYIKFLLRMVADGNACADPFGRPPPDGPLQPLSNFVHPMVLYGLTRPDETAVASSEQPSRKNSPAGLTRETFYARQPIPEDGTFCYAAAFSEM